MVFKIEYNNKNIVNNICENKTKQIKTTKSNKEHLWGFSTSLNARCHIFLSIEDANIITLWWYDVANNSMTGRLEKDGT